MSYHRFLCAAVVVLVACGDPTSTTSFADVSGPLANSRVVSHTNGEGSAQLPPGFSALTFTFRAALRADGSSDGEFSYRYQSSGGVVDFDGAVTCVTFDAARGRAWVGGVVTRNGSTHPGAQQPIHQVGRDVWFRVVDNGEGTNASDDRTTVLGFEGGGGFITSAEYCAKQPWAANDANTWAVIAGNIQVKP